MTDATPTPTPPGFRLALMMVVKELTEEVFVDVPGIGNQRFDPDMAVEIAQAIRNSYFRGYSDAARVVVEMLKKLDDPTPAGDDLTIPPVV